MFPKSFGVIVLILIFFVALVVHHQGAMFSDFRNKILEKVDKIENKTAINEIYSRINPLIVGSDTYSKDFYYRYDDFNPASEQGSDNKDLRRQGSFSVSSLIALDKKMIELGEELKYVNHVLMEFFLLESNRIFLYKKIQDEETFMDNYIANISGQEDNNTGGRSSQIWIGVREENGTTVIQRGLIRFDILKDIPKRARIISAMLKFRKIHQDYDFDVINQTVHLYELKKEWGEGIYATAGVAHHGTCSWLAAKVGELNWDTPGIWNDPRDVDDTILAAAKGIYKSLEHEIVTFYFNEEGIKRLQNILAGGPNYGWLMKVDDENKGSPLISLESMNTPLEENRPQLELIYYLPD